MKTNSSQHDQQTAATATAEERETAQAAAEGWRGGNPGRTPTRENADAAAEDAAGEWLPAPETAEEAAANAAAEARIRACVRVLLGV